MTDMTAAASPLARLIAIAPPELTEPLQQLFTFIDAPASGEGLQRVARKVMDLKSDLEQVAGPSAEDMGLWPTDLASPLQWLVSGGAFEKLAASGINPLGRVAQPHGTLTAHPIYAALWLDLSIEQVCVRDALIQSVVAHAMLPAPTPAPDPYHSAREKAGRAVRELARLDPSTLSSCLPSHKLRSATAYAKELKAIIDSAGVKAKSLHIAPLRHLIETATDQRNIRNRSSGYQHQDTGLGASTADAEVEDDSEVETVGTDDVVRVEAVVTEDVSGVEVVEIAYVSYNEKLAAEDIGAAVSVVTAVPEHIAADLENSGSFWREFELPSETLNVRFEDEPGAERSAMQHRRRVQAVGKAIARSNQKLVAQVTTLSALEIDALIEEITRACADRTATLASVKSAVLVCCSLATGRSFEDLAGIVDGVTDVDNPVWLERQGSQYFFGVRRLVLQGEQDLTPPGEEQAVEVGWQAWLPCPSLVQKLLVQILPGTRKNMHVGAATLIAGAKQFLAKASKAQSAQFTERRVQSWLFGQILNLNHGGIAAAALITGTSDPSATNPAQYLTMSSKGVIDLYLQSTMPLNRLKPVVTTKNVPVPLLPISAVGSRYMPRQKALSAFIAKMQNELAALKRTDGSFVAIHNIMTLYTVMMSCFAAGFRTVREPILRPWEIDETTGFAVLQDKDSQDGYNARLLWVPLVMRDQLKFYAAHLEQIRAAIETTDPARYQQMEPSLNGQPSFTPGLFLLDESGVSRDATVSVLIEAFVKAGWHLPLNAGRHYLQSCLRRHCSNETMLAFLGHWSRGTEPWAAASGFDPTLYREDLEPALTKLLDDDGWKALPGFKL